MFRGSASYTAVLATGMGRSGTSLLGAMLRAAGLDAGPSEAQMMPTLANPLGYAELQSVADFNDAILASTGLFWDAPPAWPDDNQVEASPDVVASGRHLISRHFSKGVWFVKDPRLCIVLPVWRQMLVDRAVVVFSHRNALDVAWSLHVRDRLSMSVGIALWAAYHRHLAHHASGLGAIALDYDALVERPPEVAAEFVAALGRFGLVADADPAAVAAQVADDLRRRSIPSRYAADDVPTLRDVLPDFPDGAVASFERLDLAIARPHPWEADLLDEHRALRSLAAGHAAGRGNPASGD